MTDRMNHQKLPASVFDQVIPRENTDSVKWERYGTGDVLPMWVADMDFAAASPIQAAIEQRLKHPVYGYTQAPPSLFDALAAHLDEHFDWKIERDWVVYLPGVVPGLSASCRAFCADGAHIMVNPPIYHHFYDAHDARHQSIVKVPLHKVGQRWTYDLKAMAAACVDEMSMIMMCSPHNPTGTVFTTEELQAVGRMCQQHNMMMISDEIHCDLVIDRSVKHVPTAVACADYADNIVTLMSGSKTWNLAGLNSSFAIISNSERREQFRNACQSVMAMTPPLAYTATEAAYREGGPWRDALLDYLAESYAYIAERISNIPGLKLEPMQATYLAWIDASALSLNDTTGFFEDHGVGFSSGEQFGQPHFVRMNFACPRSIIDECLTRVEKAVASVV